MLAYIYPLLKLKTSVKNFWGVPNIFLKFIHRFHFSCIIFLLQFLTKSLLSFSKSAVCCCCSTMLLIVVAVVSWYNLTGLFIKNMSDKDLLLSWLIGREEILKTSYSNVETGKFDLFLSINYFVSFFKKFLFFIIYFIIGSIHLL